MAAGKTLLLNLRPVKRRNPAPARRRAGRPSLDKRVSPRLPSHQHPEQGRCREGRLSRRLLNLRPVKRPNPALVRRRAVRFSRDKRAKLRLLNRQRPVRGRSLAAQRRLRSPDLVNRQHPERGERRALQASPLLLHSNRWPDQRSRNP